MQCSHHQKPIISSALWSDVPVHEQNREEKWRKREKAQESRQECFWVINKWETPFGIQTNQSLSYRTSFSHSASVEKTAANQARDYGIGMQQRAAMRFAGGLLSPLSQQSAVSTLSLSCRAPEVHPRNVAALLTRGEAPVHVSRHHAAGQAPSYKSERGCADKQKGDAVRLDPRRKTRYTILQFKFRGVFWVGVRAHTHFLSLGKTYCLLP